MGVRLDFGNDAEKTVPIHHAPSVRTASRTPHGDSVDNEVYFEPRITYSADDGDFWCGHSLEHGETIYAPTFTEFALCLKIRRAQQSYVLLK